MRKMRKVSFFQIGVGGFSMQVLRRLWAEDDGFVLSTEAIIVCTMLICAVIVGFQSIRVSMSEAFDIADAIAALDQTYSFSGFTGHGATCSGSFFGDNRDFCDDADCLQVDGGAGRCVVLVGARKEDGTVVDGSGP